MANSKKLVVDLKGPKQKRAPLSDFSTVCNSLHACLKGIGRCIGKGAPEFDISDLHMGSAVMAIEPDTAKEGAIEIANLFRDTIAALEEGQAVDKRLDYSALHCFRGFSGVARKEGVTLKIGTVKLTENYANNLAALLDPASAALGSVSGRLETFTLHNQNKFILYPAITGEEVDCIFQRKDLPRVLEAVDRQVTVFGTLHYAQSKIYPVRVDVDDFAIIESDSELPTLLDAKGILPPPSADNPLLDRSFSDEWY
jgi:hypothetical protein